uniref:ZP domain-containing protein n=1 Tax=Panagrolaimus davidi TaxID=227884 RepID=A0A914Q8G6_9BILA
MKIAAGFQWKDLVDPLFFSSGVEPSKMFKSILLPLLLLSLIPFSYSTHVENGIIGTPIIECTSTALRFRLKTEKIFEGRLFVKGFAKTDGCFINGFGKFTETGIEVPFDSPCRVDRERSANPRGIFVTSTIVVSFHPLFITSIDRAYRIKCLYFAGEQKVKMNLGVNALPPNLQRIERMPMPICRYELLDGGPYGPPIAYATVGQKVYHKWTCEPVTTDSTFCMIVHSCVVDSGLREFIDILDRRGCALDSLLLPDLEYSTDLIAGQQTQVYKYADRDTLFFQCQISISAKKHNSICPRPDCISSPIASSSEEESKRQPPIIVKEELNVRIPRKIDYNFEVLEIVDVSSRLQAIENFGNETINLPKPQKQIKDPEICFPFAATFLFFGWLFIIAVSGFLIIYLRIKRSRAYIVN